MDASADPPGAPAARWGRVIPHYALTADVLPEPRASWSELVTFAGTFDGYVVRPTTQGLSDYIKDARGRLQVTDTQVARLESEIDTLNRDLEALRSFVLPGGSPASSHLHLARTISRRAERLMVALAARQGESVGDAALRYINRLSDFLFVAARFANDKGKSDVTWASDT